MMDMILEAKGVGKRYFPGGHQLDVLENIDFEVREGESISIIGPSGAGKSTLLHILGGLDDPSSGQVRFNGHDIYQLNDKERSAFCNVNIGFVFQFYHLLPEFTALENVALPAMIRSNARKPDEFFERSALLLDQVGLAKRSTHKPMELSGGEQQRVAVARALINEPKIVFCDEPTGNLNSETGAEIISLLEKLNKENEQTFVIVTHDEALAQMSSRVVNMRDGNLIKNG